LIGQQVLIPSKARHPSRNIASIRCDPTGGEKAPVRRGWKGQKKRLVGKLPRLLGEMDSPAFSRKVKPVIINRRLKANLRHTETHTHTYESSMPYSLEIREEYNDLKQILTGYQCI
jgi:hypothetical protein